VRLWAAGVLEGSRALTPSVRDAIQRWFSDYLSWMTTHPNGIEEREAKNNHGTCWVMQVAQFATYTRNAKLVQYCRDRYKSVLLPNQVATDGSFPLELRRTKPYGYSLFNLEAMTAVCQILSTKEENLWSFKLPDGRGMDKAVAFMFPYIKDKKKWPFASDVMYFDQWPVRQTSLLFGGHALGKPEYIALWKGLNPDPSVEEVIRNFPIRQPVLWISEL